ncbi:hypothetical protein ACH61_00856 [Rathayibacter tanaceti]|uniref:Uncharacterized protein n=1 Tax=Rathayibacter tanaceti TaxID=1671680 RepID=A0A166I9M9_9MICO|nr:hypothetical protein ACH61_00856 [Rathayibacter tanaceti]
MEHRVRLRPGDDSAQAGRVAEVALEGADSGRQGGGIGPAHERGDFPAVGEQGLDEVAPVLSARSGDESCGHDYLISADCSARSFSTIIDTSSGNETFGSQPRTSRAFAGSPMRRSTSAGRMNAGFWVT